MIGHMDLPVHKKVAVYFLYDGSYAQQKAMQRLISDLHRRHLEGTFLVSIKHRLGDKLKTFYSLSGHQLPVIIAVRPDDSVIHIWDGQHPPTSDHIVHIIQPFNH